jgi:5-methylcytosine-specific restriction protein B
VVGYVTSPDCAIVAICRITKGVHNHPKGESIEFEKIEQLNNPITLEELNQNPFLKQSEPLANNHQGSLFRLTEEEYSVIRSLIAKEVPPLEQNVISFTVTDALKSLFLSPSQFDLMVESLNEKKNIILQGPPGVGKTFIARRLADALTGEEESSRVEWIQFHQSYSYEDFIQGFRPTEGGHFELKNGIFYEFCQGARDDLHKRPWVFVIDEINRGNMSKIFGELMMLIEPDKRGKRFAMPLTYSKSHDEKFSVPENIYLIGLMNTADRSLSMVDYALRRRFRFITIEPAFESEKFQQHLRDLTTNEQLIEKIVKRLNELNLEIANDEKNLGTGYQIGHSYFCPAKGVHPDGNWYQRVVRLEIKPLLEEYWLDDQIKVSSLINRLLE